MKARSTQEKFLALACAIVEKADLEPIVDLRFANDGTLKATAPDSMKSRLIIKFSFQDAGVSLEATPRIKADGWNEYTGQFWAEDNAALDQALTDIATALGVER